MALLFILLLLSANLEFSLEIKDCEIALPVSDDDYLPMLIRNTSGADLSLMTPDAGKIRIKRNERLVLSCPSSRNEVEIAKANLTAATCITENLFLVSCRVVAYHDLRCRYKIKASIKKSTEEACGDGGGKSMTIGHPIRAGVWFTLVKVCYDYSRWIALYTEHEIPGKEIEFRSKNDYRPSFSTSGAEGVPAEVVYRRAYQKARLGVLLGSAAVAEKYVNEDSYLARGHLAPDADFVYSSGQFGTYFYVNVVPQWQAINSGNWRRIETLARKRAESLNGTLRVYTGSHGVLKLRDLGGDPVEIYLWKNSLPVPEVLWKILYDAPGKRAVVFLTVNDPFLDKTGYNYLCNDVCDSYGWQDEHWTDSSRGLVYCCGYEEFRDAVRAAPRIQVDQVLESPRNN